MDKLIRGTACLPKGKHKDFELLLMWISWLVHGKEDYETTATHIHTHYVALPILPEGVASLVSESFFSEVSRINVKKIRCETGGHAGSFHLSVFYIFILRLFQIPPTGQTCSTSSTCQYTFVYCTVKPSVNAALQGRWFFMMGILVIPVPCCACCAVFAVMRMRRKKDRQSPLSIV